MSFSRIQIRKLQRDVKACDIRIRELNGRELSYIEGWHAIAEANRIFGFDGWNRETMESRCILSRESRGTHHVVYVARVRITVRAEDANIIREGFGTGEAHGASPGEAHEKAIKTAETDATKRALATFGKPFGLSLYLSSKRRPGPADSSRQRSPDIERRRTLQKLGGDGRYYVARPRRQPLDPTLANQQSTIAQAPVSIDAEQDAPHNPPAQDSSSSALDLTMDDVARNRPNPQWTDLGIRLATGFHNRPG